MRVMKISTLSLKNSPKALLGEILTVGDKTELAPEIFAMTRCEALAKLWSKARHNCVVQEPERDTAVISDRYIDGRGVTILEFDAGMQLKNAGGYRWLSQIHVSPGARMAEARLPVFFFDVGAKA